MKPYSLHDPCNAATLAWACIRSMPLPLYHMLWKIAAARQSDPITMAAHILDEEWSPIFRHLDAEKRRRIGCTIIADHLLTTTHRTN